MDKAAALRRTSGITSRSSLNRQKTPYPLPDQSQRTPNTAGMKDSKKGFLGLEIETEEEAEEPLEMRPPREATVKLESRTPGRKRRNLVEVEHSPFLDHVSCPSPGCQADSKLAPNPRPSKSHQKTELLKSDEDNPNNDRKSPRAIKVVPGGSLASRDTSMKAETDNLVVTPKKTTVFKIPLVPAKPKKTPPIRPPPIKRSSANKTTSEPILTKPPSPEKTNEDGTVEDQTIALSEGNEIGSFEPDAITRDVYVQGSK